MRLVMGEEAGYVGLVGGRVVTGQQDGAASETSFHSVQAGFGLAVGRGGAGGELGVLLVRGDLRGGGHGSFGLFEMKMAQDQALRRVVSLVEDSTAWGENELWGVGKLGVSFLGGVS